MEFLEASEPLQLVVVNSKNSYAISMSLIKAGVHNVIGITCPQIAPEFETHFYR